MDNSTHAATATDCSDLVQAVAWCGERIARDIHESQGGGPLSITSTGLSSPNTNTNTER